MAKITFIILAHENADHVADLAHLLTEWDPHANAVIHYDLNSPPRQFERLKARVSGSKKIFLVKDRLKCGWGNFSLVDAVVRSLRVIRREKLDCERVMLVSGACMPIRPLAEFSQFLDAHPKTEFIEAFDSNWMVGGIRDDRYRYWHFFNFQTHPRLFSAHFQLQRRFWPKRRFPSGLEPRFGSQWWCLSWKLCEKILDYIQKHPLKYFFFSTVWIPDEMFFQTLAFRFTPTDDLARRNLTFFHFNQKGKPIVLMDDHSSLIKGLPFFFARKVSSAAKKLRAELADIAKGPAPDKPIAIEVRTRYRFPYEELLAAVPSSRPLTTRLFQKRDGSIWPDILGKSTKSYVLLYGPPQLTRAAADALRDIAGLTVLGRVFQPGKVDFGPGRTSFHGLHTDDHAIRDLDMASYFGRILSRVEDVAVIELCPGDDPPSEAALLEDHNAVVLPVVPVEDNDTMEHVYWSLCVGEGLQVPPAPTPIATHRSIEQTIEARLPGELRTRVENYLKAARISAGDSEAQWSTALRFRHGDAIRPLTGNIDRIDRAISALTVEEMAGGLPADWRGSIMTLDSVKPRWKALRLDAPAVLPSIFAIAASEGPDIIPSTTFEIVNRRATVK
ncbi:MAG: hypothetical protein KDJ87_02485 [Rhizobiaceae bacterium]|nr:hypothetical protein [Rhizobiaceae bacterium]